MDKANTLGNIPTSSIGGIIDSLSNAYIKLICNNVPFRTMPSVMLWGAPGVGKSQAVRQIADNISRKTKKKVNVTDVRLLLFNPIDLRGIPTANEDKTLAIWLKPQIFQMDPSEKVVNILFLDELSAAPQSVQAAAYQITLDRVVGEHKLPENCIVIAAGNRITDKSVSFKMPKALANRLMHFDVTTNVDSWLKWAMEKGINEKIRGFIQFKRDYLMKFEPGSDELAFPTPRSWEMVSNILNYIDGDIDKVFPLVEGTVGMGAAIEFRSWMNVYKSLPSVEDIFAGKNVAAPKKSDVLYALVSSMARYAMDNKDNMDMIANSIRFARKLPADYQVLLLKDYLCITPDYKSELIKNREFMTWFSEVGAKLNGII